jgi:hypothetical protein
MSTPNPEYDPNWEIKWRAAQFRVEAIGRQDNLDDMFEGLNKQYKTLEELYAVILDRLRRQFPNEDVDALISFDSAATPDDIYVKARRVREKVMQLQWERDVRDRKRHTQPDDLLVFAEDTVKYHREIQRVRWGGQDGRKFGISETICIKECSPTEAHVCFVSAPSVVRGTDPAIDDLGSVVRLPSAYFHEVLANQYGPEQVAWYYYQTNSGYPDSWFFRRASLQWWPKRTERFLWWRHEIPGDWFVRTESSSNDYHFGSVPRVIGEAVVLSTDDELPIIELPDFKGAVNGR